MGTGLALGVDQNFVFVKYLKNSDIVTSIHSKNRGLGFQNLHLFSSDVIRQFFF